MQGALLARAKGLSSIKIRLGAKVADVDIETSTIILTDCEHVEGYDLIIAADGVRSIIKTKACPPEAARAQPTGEAAYRFTLDRSLLECDEELLSLVKRPWATRWDGPSRHIVACSVRDHQCLNVVLIHPDDGGAHFEESWTSVTDKQNAVADLKGWDPRVLKLIALAPDEVLTSVCLLIHLPQSGSKVRLCS